MKLGLTSAAFYGCMETEDAAAFLQAFGLDTCEVFLESHSEYTADFGQLVRGKLGALGCTSVHPKGTQFEPDLFGQSARQRDDALSIMRGVMDAGQVLGAKYYVFHGRYRSWAESRWIKSACWRNVLARCRIWRMRAGWKSCGRMFTTAPYRV